MKHFLRILTIMMPLAFLVQCVGDDPLPVNDNGNSDVVLFINEVLTTGSPDWLEIYNPSDAEVDVSGFFITDDPVDKYAIPNGTKVPAKGFLVLLCDGTGTGLNTSFKLSSGGETVTLYDAGEKLIDEVTFPALDDGTSFGRKPDGSNNWEVIDFPSQGTGNGGNQPATISDVQRSVSAPTEIDEVMITATVVDDSGIDFVKLHYIISQTATEVTMTATTVANQYEGVIPAFAETTVVEYYVEAKDSDGVLSVSPSGAPSSVNSYTVGATPAFELFINEFMASGDACCEDPDASGEFDDWIEIYNAGNTPVDIGGMYITDDLSVPNLYQIPDTEAATTTIPAGGFIVLRADKQTEQGVLHVNLKLGSGGEAIGLFESDGLTVIDQLTFGEQVTDISFGRKPDGTDNWQFFETPTPGTSNTGDAPAISLFINEFLASGAACCEDPAAIGEFDDWIEIYNGGTTPVDIGGMYITDDLSVPNLYQIPDTDPSATTISPGGFLVLWADKQSEQGILHVEIKLGSGGEAIGLYDKDGTTELDSYTFGAQTTDVSEGRTTDGADTFGFFATPTPGTTNL